MVVFFFLTSKLTHLDKQDFLNTVKLNMNTMYMDTC